MTIGLGISNEIFLRVIVTAPKVWMLGVGAEQKESEPAEASADAARRRGCATNVGANVGTVRVTTRVGTRRARRMAARMIVRVRRRPTRRDGARDRISHGLLVLSSPTRAPQAPQRSPASGASCWARKFSASSPIQPPTADNLLPVCTHDYSRREARRRRIRARSHHH